MDLELVDLKLVDLELVALKLVDLNIGIKKLSIDVRLFVALIIRSLIFLD